MSQAGLEHHNHIRAFQVLGLQACTTTCRPTEEMESVVKGGILDKCLMSAWRNFLAGDPRVEPSISATCAEDNWQGFRDEKDWEVEGHRREKKQLQK